MSRNPCEDEISKIIFTVDAFSVTIFHKFISSQMNPQMLKHQLTEVLWKIKNKLQINFKAWFLCRDKVWKSISRIKNLFINMLLITKLSCMYISWQRKEGSVSLRPGGFTPYHSFIINLLHVGLGESCSRPSSVLFSICRGRRTWKVSSIARFYKGDGEKLKQRA